MTLLVSGGYILTLDSQGTVWEEGEILIDTGEIVGVGKVGSFSKERVDHYIDAKGKLITPGLINAHTHSPLNLVKGSFDRLDHTAFMWRNQADTANRTPQEVYISALVGGMEMLKTGTTALLDHFPEQSFGEEDVDAVIQAYLDLGMRASVALRIFDKEYADILPLDRSILPHDLKEGIEHSPLKVRPRKELIDLCQLAMEKWHNSASGRIQIMLGPSAPLRCTDNLLLEIKELAQKYNIGIHTHLLESKIQTTISQKLYSKTMVEHLNDLGLLSSRLSCAHSIWVTDNDIRLLAENKASVVHNPESNLKLGSGIAPIKRMLNEGVNIALGTDGASTNDNQILLETIRLTTIIHRPGETDYQNWISAEEALRMATRGGAKAMLQEEKIGSIEVGKRADLVLFNLDSLWFKPLNHPLRQLVYCENGSSVDMVLVDGRIIVKGGKVVTLNEREVLEEAQRIYKAIKVRNRVLYDFAERIVPYLERERLKGG